MKKHTPGPWKLDAIEGAHWNVDAEDGTAVALAQDNKDPGIRRANARLIAAAPELLEALELAEMLFKRMGDKDPRCIGDASKMAMAIHIAKYGPVVKARN